MKNSKIIILGGGLGALVCGSILSKHGYRVTILEQHRVVGGCLQDFTRGEARFDTGMHYVGSMDEGAVLNKIWKYLDLLPEIELQRLDPEGFDVIRLAGKDYKYAQGEQAFVESLASQFPDQRENLQAYVDEITKIGRLSIFSDHYIGARGIVDNPYLSTGWDDFLTRTISDPVLRNVLLGNMLLYAPKRAKTPLYLGAVINRSYMDGAYRIVGGSEQVSKILADSITNNGGEIRVNSRVERIECAEGRAKSVTLSDGTEVKGDFFISNLHPANTLKMVNPQSVIRKSYRERIVAMENTISSFSLFLRLKPDSVPYMNHNFYSYQDNEPWDSTDCAGERFGRNYLYMHQCEIADQRYARNASVMTFMDYGDVKQWQGVSRRRGAQYEALMQQCAKSLIARVERDFPGVSHSIESYHTASPLTYQHYTKTPEGSIYGTMLDINAPLGGVVTHWSKLKNLFYVGQNSYLHGMLGVTIGAILACGEFANLEKIINDIKTIR